MLGNKNQNTGKLFVLKPKTQDADKKKLDTPVFEVREKNETGQWVISKTVSFVSGLLTRADIKENDWEGTKYFTVSLYFKDSAEDEMYLTEWRLGMLSRAVFNSLLNADLSKEVKIGLYTSKKGYPSASVRQGEDLINWKYSLDEVPAPEEVKFKGKIQRDYTETDNFFVEKLRELSARLAGNSSSAPAAPVVAKSADKPAVKKAPKKAAPVEDEVIGDLETPDDDVPF